MSYEEIDPCRKGTYYMDEDRIRSIMEKLEERKTTDELVQALKDHDQEQWTDEGFEAIRRVLRNRQVDISSFSEQHGTTENSYFDVKFRTHIERTKVECPYVGNGRIVLAQDGIKVFGKTAYSKGEKILFGAGIIVFSVILQQMLNFNKLYIPSIWLLWFIVDIVILKQKNITISWNRISSIKQNPETKIIGINYTIYSGSITPPSEESVVMKSENFDTMVSELEKRGAVQISVVS